MVGKALRTPIMMTLNLMMKEGLQLVEGERRTTWQLYERTCLERSITI